MQLSAALKDDQGNVLTGRAVLWSESGPARASVSNTGLVTGLAPGGPVTIVATSEGRSGNAQVTVTPAAAAKLAFLVAAKQHRGGGAISPAVQVEIQNVLGGRVTTSTPVTLCSRPTRDRGTLSGTLTVAAVDGVATFSNLKINRPGQGYTIAAASGADRSHEHAFNITAAAACIAAVRGAADQRRGRSRAVTRIAVELLDALGNWPPAPDRW